METTKQVNLEKSTLFEKIMFAISSAGGGAFCWVFVSGFMTLYYTNCVGIEPAVVGTMMLVARLLDGGSDILMGAAIEKTNTRLGKARPWYILSAPLLAIIMYLCFNVPQNLSGGGKIAYMYVTYILVAAGAYTVYCMSETVMLARMTNDPKDTSTISTFKFFAIMGCASPVYIIANKILEDNGGNTVQAGWTKTVTLFSVLALVMVLMGSIAVKEKSQTMTTDSEGPEEKIPLKVALAACAKTPEFYILLVVFFFSYTMSGVMGASSMYYIGYVIQDFGKVGLNSTLSTIIQLGSIVALPFILKRVDKVKFLRISLLVGGIAGLLRLLAPANLTVYLAGTLTLTACNVPMMVCMWTLIPDLIFYVAKKSGIRTDGFVSMIGSIGCKVGTGIGSALVGWLLTWGRFDGQAAVQSDSAVTAIILLSVVLTSVGMLAQFVTMMFWNLDKKMEALDAETAQ